MKYVQLKINDYTWIHSQQELGRISILEILGDGNFIIRLNQNVQSSLEVMEKSQEIRWIGDMQPGYRVHPVLFQTNTFTNLVVIPTSDLSLGGYGDLSYDLIKYGAVDAWCGFSLPGQDSSR